MPRWCYLVHPPRHMRSVTRRVCSSSNGGGGGGGGGSGGGGGGGGRSSGRIPPLCAAAPDLPLSQRPVPSFSRLRPVLCHSPADPVARLAAGSARLATRTVDATWPMSNLTWISLLMAIPVDSNRACRYQSSATAATVAAAPFTPSPTSTLHLQPAAAPSAASAPALSILRWNSGMAAKGVCCPCYAPIGRSEAGVGGAEAAHPPCGSGSLVAGSPASAAVLRSMSTMPESEGVVAGVVALADPGKSTGVGFEIEGSRAQTVRESLSESGRGSWSVSESRWGRGGVSEFDSGLMEEVPRLAVNGVPFVYHPHYSAPQLPPGHRFPMQVFRTIRNVLVEDCIAVEEQFLTPPTPLPMDFAHLAHDEGYIESVVRGTIEPSAMRRIGFPWSATLVDRTLAEVAGTLLTAELALEYGMACNTAGGTHHAFRSFGSGFCLVNDLAVTALALLQRRRVRRVAIVDLDVHQGDGTAAILTGDDRVFTFSMHCGANFPARKQKSDLDVDVAAGAGDREFLSLLAEHLPHLLSTFRPDLVLYDAGVDPHADDALGKLRMTDEGLFRRDMQVLDACVGFGVPVAGVVGGGYHNDITVLARRHCLLHRAATQLWHNCL